MKWGGGKKEEMVTKNTANGSATLDNNSVFFSISLNTKRTQHMMSYCHTKSFYDFILLISLKVGFICSVLLIIPFEPLFGTMINLSPIICSYSQFNVSVYLVSMHFRFIGWKFYELLYRLFIGVILTYRKKAPYRDVSSALRRSFR